MKITLTSDAQRVVDERVRSGQYHSAEHVVEEALHLLASRDASEDDPANIERLRALVQVGIDQADRGECKPLDFEALRKRLHAEHAQRLANRGNGNGSH